MFANTSSLDVYIAELPQACGADQRVTVQNRGEVMGTPSNYIQLKFDVRACNGNDPKVAPCNNSSDTCATFDAIAVSPWLPILEIRNFTVHCDDNDLIVVSDDARRYMFIGIASYAGVSSFLFTVVLILCQRQHVRLWKLRHVYATFDSALANERNSQRDRSQRNLSRRPTRSLPPIPSPKRKTHKKEILYANAHLRLSQNSMPTRMRHSMHSVSSDLTDPHMSKRISLPLHASTVSAQNALYFFTRPGDLSPKDTPIVKTQGFTFPYNSKPPTQGDLFKHRTMNHRPTTLCREGRASDYQNWFQRFEISSSCPSIEVLEEGQEVSDKVKLMVPAPKSSSPVPPALMHGKVDRRKRRSLLRNRLSSVHKDQTLPRRKLPSLSRPLSEALLNPVNPYVERGSMTPSSPTSP